MDKNVVAILDKIKLGGYSQPMPYTDEHSGKKGVRLVYLKSKSEPHRMNMKDDYNRIAAAALDEKIFKALD